MHLEKKIKLRSGFTFIELIVSIFIIAIITGLLLTNYHFANKRSRLINTVQELAGDIRLAQQFSLGSKKFDANGNGKIDAGEGVPDGGWGVHTLKSVSTYYIFADLDSQGDFDSSEAFKKVQLPKGTIINSISTGGNMVNIIFFPPDPVTYINGIHNSSVEIELSDGETIKTVGVNSLGLVDVVD